MFDPSFYCALCGLSLRRGQVEAKFQGKNYRFCCTGCRQVFTILMEATDSADPQSFRESELYKQCLERGIIPKSEADLDRKAASRNPEPIVSKTSENAETIKTASGPSENLLELTLKIGNMWCPACAWVIEETLNKCEGIFDSGCNFTTDRLHVKYNPVQTSPSDIMEIISKLGYRATASETTQDPLGRRKEFVRFALSAFLTMNIMMLSYALFSGFFIDLTPDAVFKLSWPAFLMATAVMVYGGWELYKKAWAGLTKIAFSMESLIILGASSAYFLSVYNFYQGSIHIYFDTASMLITLVLLGKTIEQRAKGQVLESIESFLSLRPTKVRICTKDFPDGRYVSAEQLIAGDVFRVIESEIVAADGRILSGNGSVDESSLTGEPLPLAKKPGHRIRSGTRVIRGAFKIRADKVGHDATLGQMIDIIEKTLLAKTPLEGKTDLLLQWFVPIILCLAAGTGLVCHLFGLSVETSILRAVTVMVISCPCALGIAIPLARAAGVSLAGKKGILVRDFSAFEQAEKIDTFVFDKTGTMTMGRWNLQDIIPMAPYTKDQVLALAAGLEKTSDHFIADEILDQAHKKNIIPHAYSQIKTTAKGMIGRTGGREIKIGASGLLHREIQGADFRQIDAVINEKSRKSIVYLGVEGQLAALFVFGDDLRKDARSTVRRLIEKGYRLSLVSGDGQRTTTAVGQTLGIEAAFGNQMPQDKAAFVAELQNSGYQVAMVGDGINDAPALLQANLSVAIYSGGQLSREAANITLMRGEPGQVIEFLEFADQVNKKIKQNLIFTYLYNIISIPIAMSGLLTPLFAVVAMLLSSLSVTGNTLLLVKKNA
jgi:heavy metal translocating P-type ATPase